MGELLSVNEFDEGVTEPGGIGDEGAVVRYRREPVTERVLGGAGFAFGRIFPPEPNTILPSNAMIQRWLWFVADCIPPDYVLRGRQADFEGI